jgi:hypothetical protein
MNARVSAADIGPSRWALVQSAGWAVNRARRRGSIVVSGEW